MKNKPQSKYFRNFIKKRLRNYELVIMKKYRHCSDLNEKACCIKKDVEMGDEENDVFVWDVKNDVINVVAMMIRFGFLLDSGKSFFLFIIQIKEISEFLYYFILLNKLLK